MKRNNIIFSSGEVQVNYDICPGDIKSMMNNVKSEPVILADESELANLELQIPQKERFPSKTNFIML